MRYDDQVRGELEELSKSLGFRYVPKEELEDGLTRLRKDIRDGSLAGGPEDGLLLSFWDHAGWPPILCLWKKAAAYGQEGSGAGQVEWPLEVVVGKVQPPIGPMALKLSLPV